MAVRVIQNGYTFSIDTNGTTIAAGRLQDVKAERNAQLQAKAGGVLRESGDQGGHLVAAQHNGPPISENLFAQDGRLNQGVFKSMENAEHRLISNPQGKAEIYTERTAFVSNVHAANGMRPDAFMIHDNIAYGDGRRGQDIHLSFSNMSVHEQEEINHVLETSFLPEEMPNPGDALREFLSPEEYTQLMEETDTMLPNIRDEFDEQITNDRLEAVMEKNTDTLDINGENTIDSSVWNFETQTDDTMEANAGDTWDVEVGGGSVSDADISIDDGMDSSLDED